LSIQNGKDKNMIQQSFGFVHNDVPKERHREKRKRLQEELYNKIKEEPLEENVKLSNMEEKTKSSFKIDINAILPKVLWIVVFASFAYMGHTFIQLNQKVEQLSILSQRTEVTLTEAVRPKVETLEEQQTITEDALSSLNISNAEISAKLENVEDTSSRILNILLSMED
jgi:hypothetical protein